MKKGFYIFIFLFIFLFIFPNRAFASTITLSSSQTSILAPDEELIVDVNLSVSTTNGTIYYLRGEFYQQGTTNYCGFTWNEAGWYNGSVNSNGWLNLLPVTIQGNVWTGQIRAKFDSGSQSCGTSGDYNFRVQRYTSSGSSSTDTETPLTVTVLVPTPAPTPTPIPTATPTPTVTPTPTPSSSKSVYKINTPKDGWGSTLTSVQIYVDGQYIHHEDNEILEFYDGHECYSGVGCGFGVHTVSLRKDGYSNWEDGRDFIAGMNLEVIPVLVRQTTPSPTSTPTPTPTKSSTPIASPKPTAQAGTPTPTDSPEEEVLGEETIFPSPTSDPSPDPAQDPPAKPKSAFPIWAIGLTIVGVGLIGFSIFSIIRSAKKGYTIESEKQDSEIS